jgi:NADH dehydrogenase
MTSTHRVVIVGGGFGGLQAARSLKRAPVQVTLIDRRNFHLFQPLLYQVATGGLSPANIAAPLRSVLRRQKNVEVILGDAVDIDVAGRRVILSDGEVPYDTLIVAAGATHSYFGRDEWAALAPGLKTVEDATEIRRRILLAFEAAEREPDAKRREAWMTFVLVGGGPTGCELAGALSEIARHTLRDDFRRINPWDAKLILVEASDRVLSAYPPELSAKARESLERLGITVRTGTLVTDIHEDDVVLKSGERTEQVPARTVIWAAGVKASNLGKALATQTGAALDRAGRVSVEPDLTLPAHPEIFVIGDMANYVHQGGKPLPGVAPVAMQQGGYAAKTIDRRLKGKSPLPPFRYKDRGSMATIGRRAAVAQVSRFKLSGFLAWLMWLFVHLIELIEFQNRLLVLIQWAWNYLTFNRSARLITGPVHSTLARNPTVEPTVEQRDKVEAKAAGAHSK